MKYASFSAPSYYQNTADFATGFGIFILIALFIAALLELAGLILLIKHYNLAPKL